MKPIIAITPTFDKDTNKYALNKDYANAVTQTGGIPIIPAFYDENLIPDILDFCNGLILSGGGDIHSMFFRQELSPEAKSINVERDKFEIMLCKAAIEKNTPMLCICRGIQVLNVAQNGDLIQHIDGHDFEKNMNLHNIAINKNSLLHKLLKQENIDVNSRHHQSVGVLGSNIVVTAFSSDGIVEAVELTGHDFCLGVQWHPESIFNDNELQQLLFKGFVEYVISQNKG